MRDDRHHAPDPPGRASGRRVSRDAGASARAAFVAYAALLPLALLLGLALASGIGPIDRAEATEAMLVYAAILVSYQAGVHSGRAMRTSGSSLRAVLTVIPPLIGWSALLLPNGPAAALLAVALAAEGALDVWAGQGGVFPVWHGRLRARTTPIAVALLVAAFLALPP